MELTPEQLKRLDDMLRLRQDQASKDALVFGLEVPTWDQLDEGSKQMMRDNFKEVINNLEQEYLASKKIII